MLKFQALCTKAFQAKVKGLVELGFHPGKPTRDIRKQTEIQKRILQ